MFFGRTTDACYSLCQKTAFKDNDTPLYFARKRKLVRLQGPYSDPGMGLVNCAVKETCPGRSAERRTTMT